MESKNFIQGEFLFNNGQYEEALPCFQEALIENPEDSDTHYFLAITFLATGNKVRALENFQMFARLEAAGKEEVNYLEELAELYYENHLDEEAIVIHKEITEKYQSSKAGDKSETFISTLKEIREKLI